MTTSPRRMKIGVLSLNPNLYSTKRLTEAGRERGHDMKVINYLRCYMDITARRPMVMYQGKALRDFDAVIPRIGASRSFYGTAVVRQFEMMNVFTAADSQAISRSRPASASRKVEYRLGFSDNTPIFKLRGGMVMTLAYFDALCCPSGPSSVVLFGCRSVCSHSPKNEPPGSTRK